MNKIISYEDFDISKTKLVKEPKQNVTYHLHYNNTKYWKLKIPRAVIKGNYTRTDKYSTIDIEYPLEHTCLRIIEEIDKKVCSTDKLLPSIRYADGSFVLKFRIDSETKFYDKNGKLIDLKDHSIKDLLQQNDTIIGLLIRLENIRIGQDISKCNWYLDQIRLNKIPKGPSDCEISDSDYESD